VTPAAGGEPANVTAIPVSGVPPKLATSPPHAVTFAGPALAPRCIADEAFTGAVGEDSLRKIFDVADAALDGILEQDGKRLQATVDPARGLSIQWAPPIPQRDVAGVFKSRTKLRGWCRRAPEKGEVVATARDLLGQMLAQNRRSDQGEATPGAHLLGGFEDGDDRPKLDRRWEGPWSASGDVCWVRGALFPYRDEVAIPVANGASPALVFVLATDGGTPRLVGVLSTDIGVPCD
jgi:hypothetical protein